MVYADDDRISVGRLANMRLAPLLIGLVLGVLLSFVTSRFEEVLAANVHIAFFIPFIVYMADAVGTQTQSIYVRDLKTGQANFIVYLFKESVLGLILGLICSALVAVISLFWFKSTELTIAVALSMFGAIASAPIIALVIAEILKIEHSDPAVGGGPIATVIQDTISVLIYGLIASAIIL